MNNKNQVKCPIILEIGDELDLHTFRPREVKPLLKDYLEECRARGIMEVRVIHGKGTGQLRRTVHGILGKLDGIESFHTAPPEFGGHGATIVRLKPR